MTPLANWISHHAKSDHAPPKTLFAFLRWALRGSEPVLLLSAAASITAGIVEMLSGLVLGLVIDASMASPREALFSENFWILGAAIAFFLLIRPLAFGASSIMQSYVVAPNVHNLVLSRLHRWVLGHSVSFFENDFAGRIAQKEMQTARAVTDVVIEILHTVLFALASVLGALAVLGAINLFMGSALLLWILSYVLVIRHFMPLIRARSAARAGARANVTGQVVDTVTNIKTVKLFAHDGHEDQAALTAMEGFRGAALDHARVSVVFRFWLMGLAGILPIVLVGSTLVSWSQGNGSVGMIATAGAVSLRLAQMTGWVSFTLMALYGNLGEVENGMKTFTPAHDLTDDPAAQPLKVTQGAITFDQTSFAYGREKGGIENISLTIQPGEKLGIIGASGAGKSTLISLLLRLHDPESGQILIDGQNIQQVTQESLRRAIATVTQETAMFNRAARDNILYGQPSASEAQVRVAAQKAEADAFIQDLEDFKGRRGYEAHLGERGVKLSGGQRQRIALARAILKDAPILVLDEATSALDSEVEAYIQDALDTVMEGKTVLAIAHRLSTIARMDRIIVLDQGKIIEAGSHDSLLAQGGLYARYWNRQSGGFIGLQPAAE